MVVDTNAHKRRLQAMNTYWCRFFDRRGSVIAAERVVAADDAAALRAAERLLAEPAKSFVLRMGDRVVPRHEAGRLSWIKGGATPAMR
jgi:hypothetical protein